MYRKDRRRGFLLYLSCAVAITIALALIGFLAWTLVLRTEYRAFCLEVNDVILKASAAERTIRQGDTELPLTWRELDYYDQILLDRGTNPISRARVEPDEDSLILAFGERRLIITCVDNTRVGLIWQTEGTERCYTVSCEIITWAQMNAFFSNMARAAAGS